MELKLISLEYGFFHQREINSVVCSIPFEWYSVHTSHYLIWESADMERCWCWHLFLHGHGINLHAPGAFLSCGSSLQKLQTRVGWLVLSNGNCFHLMLAMWTRRATYPMAGNPRGLAGKG